MVVPQMMKNSLRVMNDGVELPTIDLRGGERSEIAGQIVKASEEYGFFKVVNHGVNDDVIAGMERECRRFFAQPLAEKQLAGPAKPYGYGMKNIGFNGDVGEIEYILLHADPLCISHHSNTISANNPTAFRCAVSWYVEAVRRLASEILDLMADGLLVSDTKLFSRLINDSDTDSLFRLNHYPPTTTTTTPPPPPPDSDTTSLNLKPKTTTSHHLHQCKVGIGEHSDPQILTVLRSNDVAGLQISLEDKVWVPVPPDPTAFWVNVGDVLQAMTNGRFVSVRHRAVTNSERSRMSMAYFAAPALNAVIRAPTEVVTEDKPCLYRPFTWAEYKRTTYSLRLGESRLHLFRSP